MTPSETATYLKIGKKTVMRLLREGKLPGRKVGGQWRISTAALDTYLVRLASSAAATDGIKVDSPSQLCAPEACHVLD